MSRRFRSSRHGSSRIFDDQTVDLVSKLQQLLPKIRPGQRSLMRFQHPMFCKRHEPHIRNLHQVVDDLSERLSKWLQSTDPDSPQASIIRSLIV